MNKNIVLYGYKNLEEFYMTKQWLIRYYLNEGHIKQVALLLPKV